MSGIIRAARVSVESRILPVPQALPPRPRSAAPPTREPIAAAAASRELSAAVTGAAVGALEQIASSATTPAGGVGPTSDAAPAQPQSPTRVVAEELEALRRHATESGREQGREQGLQQGRAAGEREGLHQIQLLRAVVEELRAAQLRALGGLAQSATDIVLVAVGKILGDAFVSREAALAAVQEAVRRCQERSHLRVCVAPGDFEVLSARHDELLEQTRAGELEFVADERVALGGCIVESATGSLDARLEVQLQRLHEAVLNTRAQWKASESELSA
jgi:flagellar assembly protein FliH